MGVGGGMTSVIGSLNDTVGGARGVVGVWISAGVGGGVCTGGGSVVMGGWIPSSGSAEASGR